MRERPILFSGAMVRAILDGRKTMTRRIIKPQPEPSRLCFDHRAVVRPFYSTAVTADCPEPKTAVSFYWLQEGIEPMPCDSTGIRWLCPYGQPGDRLWVRETWQLESFGREYPAYHPIYRASSDYDGPWRPSIFMPRKFSRIALKVTAVRVEMLQDITEADAMAEGVNWQDHAGLASKTAKKLFRTLWQSINGLGSWEANPWVWVIEFRRVMP